MFWLKLSLVIVFVLSAIALLRLGLLVNRWLPRAVDKILKVRIAIRDSYLEGNLTEYECDFLLGKFTFKNLLKNAWYLGLAPWVWSTKQCFHKKEYERMMIFYEIL